MIIQHKHTRTHTHIYTVIYISSIDGWMHELVTG
jgi:hypothetical protein